MSVSLHIECEIADGQGTQVVLMTEIDAPCPTTMATWCCTWEWSAETTINKLGGSLVRSHIHENEKLLVFMHQVVCFILILVWVPLRLYAAV